MRSKLFAISAVLLASCASSTSQRSQSQIPADTSAQLSKVWLIQGVTFRNFDVLYVADVMSNVDPHERHAGPVDTAAVFLKMYISGAMRQSRVFPRVTDRPLPRNSTARVLRLQCTIEQLTKGSQSLRYWVGLGTGHPHMHVRTQFIEEKTGLVVCEAEKGMSGLNAGTAFIGGYKTDSDLLEKSISKYAKHLGEYVTEVSRRKETPPLAISDSNLVR